MLGALSQLKLRERVAVWHNGEKVRMPIRRLMELWDRGCGRVGITDLHFRNSPVEDLFHLDRICHFDVLHRSSDDVRRQEMMTFILSTKGQVTDSHSDDPDGSNHCLLGRKLWLAWDTFEGLEKGLEDVSRIDHPVDRAAFDLDTLLSLRSSRWFYMKEGETLFLPGNLTHKVITLEKYAGISAFYVALPNFLRTISRWALRTPLWVLDSRANRHLADEVSRTLLAHLRRVRRSAAHVKRRNGFDFLTVAHQHWKREYDEEARRSLLRNAYIAGFLRGIS